VDQLAEAVKSTLAQWRTSSLEKTPGRPLSTNDGVTNRAGDPPEGHSRTWALTGTEAAIIPTTSSRRTTTATVIAQAIVREEWSPGQGGQSRCGQLGASDLASAHLVEYLARGAPRSDRGGLINAPGRLISSNDDDAVGAVIAKALFTVGDGGIGTVEEKATPVDTVDFGRGFSRQSATCRLQGDQTPAALEAIVDDPDNLLCARRSQVSRS